MKKGETKHHLCYNPEIVVKIPSKWAHLLLTSLSTMKPTKQNIEYMDNLIKSILIIKWQKESLLRNELK